jgi:hypothetical protein
MPNNDDIAFCREINKSNQVARDKALLTLCSAALGFSLLFFEKSYEGQCLELLIATWILLAFSLLATVYSFEVSARTGDKLESYLVAKGEKNGELEDKITERNILTYNALAECLNIAALMSFTFGIITFMIFAISNAIQEDRMSKTTQIEHSAIPRTIEKGSTIPTSMLPSKVEAPAVTVTQPIPVASNPPTQPPVQPQPTKVDK